MFSRTASIVAAVAVAGVLAAANAEAPSFESWLAAHPSRRFGSDADLERARANYAANQATAAALNAKHAGGFGVEFTGAGPYADMDNEEFRARVLMRRGACAGRASSNAAATRPADDLVLDPTAPVPPSFDWVEKGAVTPVKDQGTVGTCWAFSTTGNIEGQHFLGAKAAAAAAAAAGSDGHAGAAAAAATGTLISLSEEYLVDCDPDDCGVFGGYPVAAMEYVAKTGGLPAEAAYPYCSGDGTCYPCMADHNKTQCGPGPEYCNKTQNAHCPEAHKVVTISGHVDISKDESVIAAQLVARGPLSVLMDASWLQYYKSGVWNTTWCDDTGKSQDHAVLMVGYGTDAATNQPYWTIKNSWGETWGEKGYFRILRGVGKCGINANVVSATV